MTKRCLVTGGCGFVGSHVIDYFLKNTDYDLISLDRLDFSGNLNRLQQVVSKHDLVEQKRVKTVFHDLKAEMSMLTSNIIGDVDIILHLAAGSHVDRSITHPMEFVLDNVVGTVNLLNYARTLPNLERFIYFSTDEIFGPAPDGVSYKERDRYNSTNAYSASKASAEEFCVAFRNCYKLPIYVTHTMNIYGLRQHPEKFIPMTIRKVRDDELNIIHSDPTQSKSGSRHYIHASDVADALWFLLNLNETQKEYVQRPDYGGATCPKFNIVGEEHSNLEMLQMIALHQRKTQDIKYELIDNHSNRPGHDTRYSLDGTYMEQLGWVPQFSTFERLKEVVDWSLKHPEWLEV